MAIWVTTARGRRLRLGSRLDNGGEGVVFEVDQVPGLVAKLLLRPGNRQLAKQRLDSLGRHRRSPRTAERELATPRRTAWPIETVTTTDGNYLGYLMPDLRGSFRPLDCLLLSELRQVHLPAATWATGLTAAESLAELVVDLHAAGYVVGDLKKENLWVDQHGQVAISDVDSFQFTDSAGFFPCTSRTPGYTAPEGIGAADTTLDDASDDFVLAILVYQLLMIGMHPFFGQPANGQPYVSYDDNIAMGRARLVSPQSVVIRPGDPPGSVLPADLQVLFRRCFDDRGRSDRSVRPPASQWQQRLRDAAAAGRLRWCDRVQAHVHTADRRACPWCELAVADTDPYPGPGSITQFGLISDEVPK